MNWSILKDVVGSAAPMLGNLLLGPFGGTIGTLIAHAFGINSSNPADILTAISNDPDAAVKLKGLELEHEDLLAKLNQSDTADARQHDEIMEQHGFGWIVPVLALFIIVGFFVVTIFLALDKVNASEYQILYLLLGQLSAGFISVIGFYFGSSNNQNPIKK